MSEHEKQEQPLSDLPATDEAYAESVRGGFNPQPDPPKMLKAMDPTNALTKKQSLG